MNEQYIQKGILGYLANCGYWVIKVITCNKSGCMDVIACAPGGIFVGIEVKYGRNTPSDLQLIAVQEVLTRGGVAFIAWSLDEVVMYLTHYKLPNSPLKLCPPEMAKAPAFRTAALLATLGKSEAAPHGKL